jgi:hypothetical protein
MILTIKRADLNYIVVALYGRVPEYNCWCTQQTLVSSYVPSEDIMANYVVFFRVPPRFPEAIVIKEFHPNERA